MTVRRARVAPPAPGGPGAHTRPHCPPLRARGRRSRLSATAVALAGLLVLAVGVAAVASDRTRPNDPMFDDQWGLENTGQMVNWTEGEPGADIDATRAWNLTTGSRSVVVAVVDGQLDYEAEDLAANAWSNPGGVNGCPAGSHGYDVPSGDCNPRAEGGHGTYMAYTIGAVGDNDKGLAGVNWTTSLMGVSYGGQKNAVSAAAAIDWVIEARKAGVNVRVINASWGNWVGNSSRVRAAIERAGEHGILFVSGAGNTGEDNDTTDRYPCNFGAWNQICTAASDQRDELAPGSSYGAESVHLAAPGHHICGSPNSSCSGGTSTSHATAYVSGVAALVWAYDPGLSVEVVRSKILGNVDKNDALSGKVATGGRLNAYRAMTGAASWSDPSDDSGGNGDNDGGSGGSDGGGGGSDADSGDSGDDGSGESGSGGSDGGSDDGDGGSGGSGNDGGGSGDDGAGSGGGGSVSVGGSDDGGGRRTVEGSTATPGTGSSDGGGGGTSTSDDDGQGGGSSGAGQGGAGSSQEGRQTGWNPSDWEFDVDLDAAGADHDVDDDAEGGSGPLIVGGQGKDPGSGDEEGGVSGWLWVALLAAAGLLALLARKPGGQVP